MYPIDEPTGEDVKNRLKNYISPLFNIVLVESNSASVLI